MRPADGPTAPVWLLDRSGTPSWEMSRLAQQLAALGIDATPVDWRTMEPGAGSARLPAAPALALVQSRVATRHTGGDLALLYDWLDHLTDRDCRVVNRVADMRRCRNKMRQAAILKAAGLPVPETRAAGTLQDVENCLADWGEIVLKPVIGHASIDMTHLRAHGPSGKEDDLLGLREEIVVWHLLQDRKVLCAQPFVPNPGRDVRVTVVGQTVAACVYQHSTAPDKHVRHHLYPIRWEQAELTQRIREICTRAISVLGLDLASIDLVEGPDGPVIIEVNEGISKWQRIEETDGDLTAAGLTCTVANHLAGLLESAASASQVFRS
jgi:tetrahydromethanopterin:alpha-L-glutamate ligase